MARFLSGLVMGLITFAGVAAVMSLLTAPPGQQAAPPAADLAPAITADAEGDASTAAEGDTAAATQAVTETQQEPAPAPETETAEVADPEPAPEPEATTAPEPEAGSEALSQEPAPAVDEGNNTDTDDKERLDPALPPVQQFAVPSTHDPLAPSVAVVLIDEGTATDIAALSDFPFALTIALNPANADVTTRMDTYRRAGFEVVLLMDQPDALPEDVSYALDDLTRLVPEAVALFESPAMGNEASRAVTDALVTEARARGLGLVTQPRGLNTAQKLAAQEGVPSGVVFRDFDGLAQSDQVMKRFMNQAAFRARQEQSAIMLGRVRPETISALVSWGLSDREDDIQMVPLTAVLQGDPSG